MRVLYLPLTMDLTSCRMNVRFKLNRKKYIVGNIRDGVASLNNIITLKRYCSFVKQVTRSKSGNN
jgi:hypothetical protein